MKIAFLDADEGTTISAVFRCRQEGHDARWWLKTPDLPGKELTALARLGQGLVPRLDSLADVRKFLPDVIVSFRVGKEADLLRKEGFPVVCSSEAALHLENDRAAAMDIARKYGGEDLVVPEFQRFTSIDKAREWIKTAPEGGYAFKVEGVQVATNTTTHVCESKRQLLDVLEYEERRKPKAFIIQEKIEGTEISTEAWFDYKRSDPWIKGSINATLERKRFFAGDIGPHIGAAGSIVFPWPDSERSPWPDTLEGMTDHLRSIEYTGPIDSNVIIDDEGKLNFLEFCPRLGWDAFEAFMAGYDGSIGEMFVALGAGSLSEIKFREPYMAVVKIMTKTTAHLPVRAAIDEFDRYMIKHVYRENGKLYTSGSGDEDVGYAAILEVAGIGETMEQAVRRAYNRVDKAEVPDKVYRFDLGERAADDIETLQDFGYKVPSIKESRSLNQALSLLR